MTSYILGGGITGLAAGLSSGLPVLEAAPEPGGICSSYYVKPGSNQRLAHAPSDDGAYRFELGGGHWIFGGDPTVLHFLKTLAPVKTYYRQSSVYFHKDNLYVPYPLQNHLRFMDKATVGQVLKELAKQPAGSFQTMEEWMLQYFGPTLCEKFFFPFHDLYTAGLYKTIAPQDAYKSPVSLAHVIQGAFDEAPAVGYNVSFVYPAEGLNALAHRMASLCDMRYNKRVSQIDVEGKELHLADGSVLPYDTLISTLPLNKMMAMTGLHVSAQEDPHTSVLVLNIGALRGPNCPDDHWLYNPDATSGFHRVGFYSNVDRSFLPASARPRNEAVSIYVERAFVGGETLTQQEVDGYSKAVVQELQEWGYITEAEVVDPTWIDVAYTWSYPNSRWTTAGDPEAGRPECLPGRALWPLDLPGYRRLDPRRLLCRLELQIHRCPGSAGARRSCRCCRSHYTAAQGCGKPDFPAEWAARFPAGSCHTQGQRTHCRR